MAGSLAGMVLRALRAWVRCCLAWLMACWVVGSRWVFSVAVRVGSARSWARARSASPSAVWAALTAVLAVSRAGF